MNGVFDMYAFNMAAYSDFFPKLYLYLYLNIF